MPIFPPMNPRIAVTPNPTTIKMGIMMRMIRVSTPLKAEEIAVNPLVTPHVDRIKPLVRAAMVAFIGPIPTTSGMVDAVQSTLGNTRGIVISAMMGNTKVKTPALVPLPPSHPAIKSAKNGAMRKTDPGKFRMLNTIPANNPSSDPVIL